MMLGKLEASMCCRTVKTFDFKRVLSQGEQFKKKRKIDCNLKKRMFP